MSDHVPDDRARPEADNPRVPAGDAPLPEPLESVIERFEAAWQVGEPDLDAFLAARPGDAELALELCLVDLEYRRKRGRPADPETYARRFPDPAARQRFLDEAGRAAGGPPATADRLVGTTINGVRLVRLVGEGGMGRVYEGLQDRPRRTVAVKVMKPGIASASLLKRFEYEAQVLARLQHPGIAHIYAIGTHEVDGQAAPYFVMEYIPAAKTLTQYAEEHRLSTHERLDLFRKVCEAVAHGHQKGVIHRDLKPANVVVDSAGQPKVIDFGVARSTDSDLALTTMQTDVGALVGTLQYMSPEQFDADPADLDVRLDVYALGVVLYELLTGKPPYDVRRKAIFEVARVVREEEPTPITSLDKTLRRDVAVIAGKCLQKDRNRRYSSAAELAGDVGRYLAGEPITAAPPSLWDGVTRLARRHKAAAAAVAGVAASLMAAVIGISAFAVRAERARVEADAQREVATRSQNAEAAQRQVAERALATATAESTKAKRGRYVATIARLSDALDRPNRLGTNDLFQDAEQSFRDAYGAATPEPVEFTILRPLLDESLLVLKASDRPIASPVASPPGMRQTTNGSFLEAPKTFSSVCFSPDGTRLATTACDNTVRLWDTASGQAIALLEGHKGLVNAVRFSPDGTRLVTTAADNTARLWDTATGKTIAVFMEHEGKRLCVDFCPDGTILATGAGDHTVRLWDATTGESTAVLSGHGGPVEAVVFSPDGTRLASISWDGSARIWDVASGTCVVMFNGGGQPHQGRPCCVSYNSDGTRLVTNDGVPRLWDAATGEQLAVVQAKSVNSVGFSPDGRRLATADDDGTAGLWDAATGKSIAVLRGHEGPVGAVSFSPDGRWLATGSEDQTVRLWDAETGKPIAVLHGHEGAVDTVSFSPDGTRVATGSADQTTRVWDTTTDESLSSPKAGDMKVKRVTFSPDGARLATMSDHHTVIWDAKAGMIVARLEGAATTIAVDFDHNAVSIGPGFTHLDHSTGEINVESQRNRLEIGGISFSPDGMLLVTNDGCANLWNTLTGQLIKSMTEGTVNDFCISPDGKRLATVEDRSARLWDVATGELLQHFNGHEMAVVNVGFSPDGTRLATASWDHTARLWDVASGESLVLTGHQGRVSCVTWSADATQLATASEDGTVRLWDAANGESLAVLEGHNGPVHAAVFSPDGARLATASDDRIVRLWDRHSAQLFAVLKGHGGPVTSLDFSPDGARLASGSDDHTVRLWDADTGDSLVVLEGHEGKVRCVSFSPDGRRLATAGGGTSRLWGLSNAEIHCHRRASATARARLSPIIEQWFAGDLTAVKPALIAARATMSPGDWQETADMVLIRAMRVREDRKRRWKLMPELRKQGDDAKAKQDFAGARRHYEECLKLAESFATGNPLNTEVWQEPAGSFDKTYTEHEAERELRFRIDTLLALAECLRQLDDDDEAARECAKRITELEVAAEKDPEVRELRIRVGEDPGNSARRLELAKAICNRGDAAKAKQDFILARRYYDEHLSLTEAVAAENPQDAEMRHMPAWSLGRLGDLAHAAGNLDEARARYEKELSIIEPFAAQDPENVGWQQRLALCISKLGDVARDREDFDAARRYYEKSLAMYEAVAARDPRNHQRQWDRAVARGRLADLATRREDWAEARDWLMKKLLLADGIFDASRAQEKLKFQIDMLREIAECGRKLGEEDAAAACLQRMADLEAAANGGSDSPALEKAPASAAP